MDLSRRELLVGTAATAWATMSASARASTAARTRTTIGHSVMGRPINAYRRSTGGARVRYLVIGQMHGDEPAGTEVIRGRLLDIALPAGVTMWFIPTVNPDGLARHTRTNAHGVDLNRNFPYHWVYSGVGTNTYSGPRPQSEPETRAVLQFLDKLRPQTIVSIHQPLDCVDFSGGDPGVTVWLSRHLHLPTRKLGPYTGTMTSWYNHRFPLRTAVTVELPQPATVSMRRTLANVLVEHAALRARTQ